MYLALARKYRPQDFLSVIGQDPIVKTLKNAIENQRLHHAYLFCGARGVGKTSLARILAKSINCQNGPTVSPCQECGACVAITAGRSLDVLEIDGASNNSVDNVRELREQVKYLPSEGKYKIIIIDEVHMLSGAAFNALLKTLEEPPAHVIFIFATTEPHELPITILSRCQKYDFKKMNTPLLTQHLGTILKSEGVMADAESLALIARCAAGSVRDALSLLDQVIAACPEGVGEAAVREILGLGERVLIQETFAALVGEALAAALDQLGQADTRGLDLKLFAEELVGFYRHLILLESTGEVPAELSPSEVEFIRSLKGKLTLDLLLAQYQILMNGLNEVARSDFQKTALEITFVKLSHVRGMIGLAELVASIKEKRPVAGMAGMERRATPAAAPVATSPAQAGRSLAVSPTQDVSLSSAANPSPAGVPAKDWYELVRWLTHERPQLGGFLNHARPVSFSPAKIEICFDEGSQGQALAIERRQILADLLCKHFGKGVDLVISQAMGQKKKPGAWSS